MVLILSKDIFDCEMQYQRVMCELMKWGQLVDYNTTYTVGVAAFTYIIQYRISVTQCVQLIMRINDSMIDKPVLHDCVWIIMY